jgi:hypothetical protein
MNPITPESRPDARAVIFAKDQPEYLPLPANVSHPYVETKWELTWKERLYAMFRGTMYLTVMTFGNPLQPIRVSMLRDDDLHGISGCNMTRAERIRGAFSLAWNRIAR